MGFFDKSKEQFRDKKRDDICASLQSLGIDAKMAVRGREEEEHILEGKALGVIDISEGPIRWINVCRKGDRGTASGAEYYTEYGVPDPRLESKSPEIEIKSVRKKNRPLVGEVVDLHWEGEDNGLGIIERLNSDISIKELIMESGDDVKIRNHCYLRCWIISTGSLIGLLPRELWDCYQRIANHLLADWSTS